jgi:hypothetical protein
MAPEDYARPVRRNTRPDDLRDDLRECHPKDMCFAFVRACGHDICRIPATSGLGLPGQSPPF